MLQERDGQLGVWVDDRWVPAISGGEPTTLVAIMAVAAIAATAVGTYGAISSSQRAAQASRYNAKVAEQQAAASAAAGKARADQQREQYRRFMATNRAEVGAAGVEGSTGSPLLVGAANAQQAELNAMWTEWEGKTQQTSLQSQAELFRMRAADEQQAGLISGASTLLGGASKVAGAYYGQTKPYSYGYM
jgi:hypothetical protein